jgi:hypothetical protein
LPYAHHVGIGSVLSGMLIGPSGRFYSFDCWCLSGERMDGVRQGQFRAGPELFGVSWPQRGRGYGNPISCKGPQTSQNPVVLRPGK